MANSYINLFACCLIVKGNRRSTLVDIQRGTFIFLPLNISDLLLTSRSITIGQIFSSYSVEDADEISKYFDYLIENEYAFYTMNPESFPLLSLDWKTPHHITNAIIDYDSGSRYNIVDAISQLEHLGCAVVQIRFYSRVGLEFLLQTLNGISKGSGRIRSLELILCFNEEISKEQYRKLIKKFPRVIKITVHNSPFQYKYQFPDSINEIEYINQHIKDETHCGFVSPEYFRANKYFFTESQTFNSCLNRKISIDKFGEIKNCPAMQIGYGNIATMSLMEVSQQSHFQDVWNINKDKIDICSDCEFRYLCTDCRAFTQDPHNRYSKPLKCKYDPYTMVWS
ncbi:SPASM domain peptide maturase, grasp-with-spasm system [Pedobacter westerhofensis]|uniref:SPASM domain peptide maturase, grasp-with-spasm system n=1 Tax=Pedobacter westerhofensis TaxID=425512 RepID=A0A521FU88_9SPHI|nr:grasp-with-spasm system SPASM domain peptide maturase [Pedobacter westerhofensis]SMO99140.1 SPASM domain peptide maturase, grasp-with-spasm system [Pedobacter westerhofensis]